MKKKLIFALVAVLAVLLVFLMIPKELKLEGAEEITIKIGEEFVDEGTNLNAKVDGKVNTAKAGDYVLTYSYKDQTVKRTVHVVDPDSLVVGFYGSENTKVRQGDPYIESGAFAIDKKKGPITECETKGEVDTQKPGTYEVSYTFKSGPLTKTITRKVEVIAKEDFKKNTAGIPVMMYHYVYSKDDVPEALNSNYILDTDLEAQLKYLKDNDYYFPSFDELRAYVDGKISLPEKSAIITFDDAQRYFLRNGIPIMNKYKVPATSFVIGIVDGTKKVKKYASPYVAFESHSYDMHKPGGNIGHGGVLSALTKDQIVADLQKSAKQVGANNAFAFPFGDITEDGKAAVAEAGFDVAFSTVPGKVHVGDDYRALMRVRVNGGTSLQYYIDHL